MPVAGRERNGTIVTDSVVIESLPFERGLELK